MPQPVDLWTADQTAELKRLIDSGVPCRAAAVALNVQFGTRRTRKSCASHLYDLGRRSARPNAPWVSDEHNAALKRLAASGLSFSQVAAAINSEFGTSYTKNACIGRYRRIDTCPKPAPRRVYGSPEEQAAAAVVRKREQRHAENPWLKARYERLQEIKRNRPARVTRVSKPSRQFRVSVPRPVAMTKGELRAMLTQIVLNTAAMEISP